MEVADELLLNVDVLDDGSDDEGDAPPSSGPASTPTSCASSPPGAGEEPASPHGGSSGPPSFFHHNVPYARPFFTSGRRGPGRPRKEGIKLTREGKVVRRFRANPMAARGAKRYRVSRDDSLEDLFDEDDFTMPAPEEPPYFPEKWPGKLCALCNLGERSQLGQGEMRQITCRVPEELPTTPTCVTPVPPPTPPPLPRSGGSTPVTPESVPPTPEQTDGMQQLLLTAPPSRRQKGVNKCKTPLHNLEHTDELSVIGHQESVELGALVSCGAVYIHRCCLEFTPPFAEQVAASARADDESRESLEEARVKGIVTAALLRKCTFCARYGASIPCKMSCSKYFHLPCVLASGGFQDFQGKSSFCKEHLYQVPLVCAADIDCRTCRVVGDLANLMTCVSCGAHYHGTCVGLAQSPGVRAGWSCRQCRVCQVCRGEAGGGAGDTRAVSCEQCDKLYHAACLRPIMATVPKYGWKCKCCRMCSDCGARSPGAGPSSRWHSHYTVCDSCYQQRNKGSSCPLCRRAYRAAAQRDMIRCTLCKRYVHGACDPEAEPATHQVRREVQPSYEYICPICKPLASAQVMKRKDSIEDDTMTSVSQDSSYGDDISLEQDPLALDTKPDVGLGKGKPYTVSSKIAKKKIGGFKFKGGFAASGKLAYQKRQRSTFLDFGRKRGSKPKMRGVFGVPGLGLQRPQPQDNKGTEEEPGMENKMVLCSSKDKFVLTQDLCVTCGAVGTDTEGCLIACSQCGQTYHPYCAPVKVSRVVVTLGWRCLDCTVCEGCGSRGDDARLVLCDDCDTTRHTYCAQLSSVPAGAWRCERCRRCQTCGATSPGSPPCQWMNEYTECAPCASLVMCCVCAEPYNDGELIIQCEPCSRWLHAACDGIRNEEEAEVCCRAGYQCALCRPRDALPPHVAQAQAAVEPPPAPAALPAAPPLTPPPPSLQSLGLAGEYYMDEVCLTARGINQIKQLESELEPAQARRKKRKFKNDHSEKDAVVQNTETEGATDDTKPDGTAEVKEEPGAVNATYKEGSIWSVAKDGPPPEGFTIYTTDSGVTVLRRKRQRNLTKLGIGGFVVRQRQANAKSQIDDDKDGDGSQPSGESPSNKRKPRRKPRSKLMEQFPSYMQEAFFGKDLLEPVKPPANASESPGERSGAGSVTPDSLQFTRAELECSDSENEDLLTVVSLFGEVDPATTITLSKDELDIIDSFKPKEEKEDSNSDGNATEIKVKLESGLHDDSNLVPTEDSLALKNAIMGPGQPGEGPSEGGGSQENIPNVNSAKTEPTSDNQGTTSSVTSTISPKDEFSLLGVSLDAMVREGLPDMDNNDVDEIFKGYTDDSQESQESAVSFVNSVSGSSSYVQRQRLTSPSEYASPFHTEYNSGNSQLSPAFSEGSGAWSGMSGEPPVGVHSAMQPAPPMMGMQQAGPPPPAQPTTTYNQRSADKMRADESLGSAATISAVLYANTNHPEWKTEFPNWQDRCKQILKKWRALPVEQKAPYLQRARDNRSAIRMKKAQQMSGPGAGSEDGVREKESDERAAPVTTTAASAATAPAAPVVRAPNVTVVAGGLLEADAHIRVLTPSEIMRTLPPLHNPPTASEQERACGQQRSAREAEQERQWKQLQQMRQQQTQQQQQIIQDQRVQAMARMRVDGVADVAPGAPESVPRSAFPAQRFPLYSAAGEANAADINRQLRDLLQRNPDKIWQHQAANAAGGGGSGSGGEEGGTPTTPGLEGQPFRQPLPVGARPRHPHPHQQLLRHPAPQHMLLQQQQRLAGQAIEQVRQMQLQQQQREQQQQQQQHADQKGDAVPQTGKEKQAAAPTSGEVRHEGAPAEEMDMGDMDKLEQDTTSMAEVKYVGDILGGLGGDDDEELLESLTAEIGDDFNILEYADPELDAFNDADTEHILDGLELADDGGGERHTKREPQEEPDVKPDTKMDTELRKAVKNMEGARSPGPIKTEVKTEMDAEGGGPQPAPGRLVAPAGQQRPQMFQQMYPGAQQRLPTPVQLQQQQTAMQQGLQRAGQFVSSITQQHVMGQQIIQRPQFAGQHPMHFQQQVQQGVSVGGVGAGAGGGVVSCVPGEVGAGAAGQAWARLPTGAVGIVRQDNTIALAVHQHSGGGVGAGAVQRAPPPPPPYPGTPRHPPPPPPYPQQMGFDSGDAWGDWLRSRRPLLLQNVNQEQPLLLEELLEQEKREQERQTEGEWGGPGAPAAAAPLVAVAPPAPAVPSVPLFAAPSLPAPPQPPERILTETDRQAQHLYEQWLHHHNIYVNDQLKYYEAEVQKLRRMRKSLNSKQRQLRKSGNELAPADASELLRISNEQSVLQKHLESSRKQSRQHSQLVQEYRNKQTPQNPQLAQQTVVGQQQITTNQTVFAQNQQNMPLSPQLKHQIDRQINQQIRQQRQQGVIGPDGQQSSLMGPQGRIGAIVASPHQIQPQGRIVQGARTLVIEQSANGAQQQLVRQLSVGQNERGQQVTGMQQSTMHLQQFGQQQFQTIRTTGQPTVQRAGGQRPSMSPLHIQSPHSQSPHHSLAPQSPLHHLTSPLQSPLHSQQSPLHAQQSPLHAQQSPLHTQQSPLHTQQSPLHTQQSPLHSQQQSPMHVQQSPMHVQQSQMLSQQSTIHNQQTSIIQQQQQAMHQQQSSMHMQQSPLHSQQSPIHPQQSPMNTQQSPMHTQQSPMHPHQSPMHSQQSPMHPQQSPMHTQQSPMQQQNTISSPQHFLQQLQVQRTSPQLPTPSRSPQIYQQSQIQSPVASHSPQLQGQQSMDYATGRFPRPVPGCSPLPTRFARPPHHQQGMRVGVSFGGRQTSPLGSPQPLPSPGNPSNDCLTRQQMLQRQQYSPMGGAPASPMSRSPHVPRTPTPSASPAASPAPQHDHGGGGHHGHHNAPFPPGFRYFKLGLFGGSPIWPNKSDEERRRTSHINKVSILKRRTPPRPRFGGKTPAPMPEPSEPILIDDIPESPTGSPQNSQEYVLFSSDGVDYAPEADDTSRLGFGSKSDDTDVEEIVEGEHLDDDDIVVVEPGAISPEERIATEEDFEELIDSGKPEDENTDEEERPREKPPTRTETTTKTVAVISLAGPKQPQTSVQQYKIVNTGQSSSSLGRLPMLSATMLSPHGNTKILNEVSQATVASVSIANQTISVPVLKSLNVGNAANGGKTHIKKVPLNLTNPSLTLAVSKPMTSVISVISSNMNVPKVATLSPVISLATSNTAGSSRMPISILTQHQVKQKIVKSIEQPMAISLSTAKLSSLSVTHDATLPAKIFEDDVASPDSTVSQDTSAGNDALSQSSIKSQDSGMDMTDPPPSVSKTSGKSDIDIESEISQHTELPHTLCIPEPLILGKADIKSPDPIPEKIPDNIMEGDDEDKSEDEMKGNMSLPIKCVPSVSVSESSTSESTSPRVEVSVLKTIKAIANQTKDMVIDSNMQISSEVSQESVQISIPSPTPSQEQYLNDLTMQERENQDHEENNPKQVESIEDMLSMLENIDDPKLFSVKLGTQAQAKNSSPMHNTKEVANPNIEASVQHRTPIDSEAMKAMQETVQAIIKNKESERLIQAAAIPQLSPLSQPTELTTNMANVSQQLRTIMSSLTTSKPESTLVTTTVARKNSQTDSSTPTQVNFENLLPSSKVEVMSSRATPIHRQIEKQNSITTSMNSTEPMSSALVLGSRVNTLSGISQGRRSPNSSPNLSPASMPSPLTKSPALSPLICNMNVLEASEPQNLVSVPQQVIQMPALSKIHSGLSSAVSAGHTNSSASTVTSTNQKTQMMASSILGTTLLQPTRQLSMGNMSFSSQNISSSQPPALVMTAKAPGSQDSQSNVAMIHTHNILNTSYGQKVPTSINMITSSTLLHTQLTSPLKRSKSTDEAKSEVIVGHIQPTKRHSVESVIVKSEPMETDEPSGPSTADMGMKGMHLNTVQRGDESQNVLLKQLLQTTTASTTASTIQPSRPMTIQRTAPALGSITSLEAQLARPSIPPPALTMPQEVEIPKNSPRQLTTRESFITRPLQTSIVTSTSSLPPVTVQTTTQSLMDVRKPTNIQMGLPKDEQMVLAEGPTVKTIPMYQSLNADNNLQQTIKKEVLPPQQSPVQRPFTPLDVKKELLDESSQQSAASGVSTASDQCKLEHPLKEEFPEGTGMETNSESVLPETPSEAKKRKRREYQQKRRQMQNSMKGTLESNNNANQTKKRPRKASKLEEDYDTFIDNLMVQLRQLPPMQVQEPTLYTNFAVCPVFGSGDLTKLKTKDYDTMKGDLTGEFGNARIPNVADYYNTKPFGDEEPPPEKTPASTQRGFYDQEFPPIRFDDDAEDKKLDFICKERDTDTPDSIVSCSSPECMDIGSPNRFPGLKLIDDEEEDEDSDSGISGRISPIIPIIAPVPIRVKPVSLYDVRDENDNQKTVKVDTISPLKPKMVDSPGGTESNENVTVTLTLTSGAAEDILGVLRELAGILHIPPPTAYQIIERTATPPSHKLGLYRSKGRDGKEGMPIDIQSILNGAAKFCRHCDVVILDSVVRAKASEFPLLSANKTNGEEILCDSDSELYFCSTQCYESFAWRPTNIILDGKSRNIIRDDKSEIDTNTSKDRDDFDTASTESMETDDLDIKPDIKDEKMDLSFIDSLDNDELMKEVVDDVAGLTEDMKTDSDDKRSEEETEEPERFRGIRYKAWSPGCIVPPTKYKRPTDRELTELVFRTGVAIMPVKPAEDFRKCELCGIQGDGVADGVSRLLNCDVDRWVHLNCALWSLGVYETVSGALMNVDSALAAGMNATCAVCRRLGATVRCFKVRCGNVYHLGCAVKDDCVFHKNKSAYCASHAPKGEKDNELTTLSVQRRVYVSRDEQRQVASVMLHSDMNHLIRVGGLIFLCPGHLLPHQLTAFHTPNYIYPVGYKIVRFYWSMKRVNSRCRYICWISDEEGRPHFHVQAQDDTKEEMAAATARAAWAKVLDAVAALREERTQEGVLKLWPHYVTGEDLFGLTEPAVVRVLESLPGIETLTDYRFKFGRSALLEGGLAVNPSGCARAEPRGRAPAFRRPPRSLLPSTPAGSASSITPDHPACPYSKQFVHTKSSQYKKMKLEWRNNVYLARSKIQGLGLYAARDIEKHTMVIEYIGELIRSELSEIREKQYEARNRGIYMFRLDDNRVVDATMSGGLARYINHSCQPNCVAEAVEVDRHLRIIIFAKRRISRGEELAYDYKFDIEDDAHKIMCMCGAPNCRKWMN